MDELNNYSPGNEIKILEDESIKREKQEEVLKKSEETYDEITAHSRRKQVLSLVLVGFNVIVLLVIALVEFVGKKDQKPMSFHSFFHSLGANWIYLLFALGMLFLCLLSSAAKISIMLKATTGKFYLLTSLKTAVLGKYYDNITPLGSGGQPFQMYNLSKKVPVGIATSVPIADFFTNQISFFILAIFVFATHSYVIESTAMRIWAYIGAGFYLLISVSVLLFSLAPKAMTKVGRVVMKLGTFFKFIKKPDQLKERLNKSIIDYSDSIKTVGRNPFVLILCLALSLIHYISFCSIPYFVLMSCGNSAGWLDIMCMGVFTYAAIAIVPTPGNSGAAEGAFYIIFNSLEGSFLFWGTLLWRFFGYYLVLLLGVCVILFDYIKNSKKPKRSLHLPAKHKE